MKFKFLFITSVFCLPFFVLSQQKKDTVKIKKSLKEIIITSELAGEKTPVTFKNITKKEISKFNLGQDLPYIISHTPSVVTTSDAGAGIGYTGFRIRGTDPTRINVTINGIPLNDSESQGVWWVNMPDFASSVDNIQIQRGVGTSKHGAGAFGASINLNTIKLNKKPYAVTTNMFGSYSSMKNNLKFGTGLLNNRFSFDGRISKISSDGYIDRASSNLKSLFIQGNYFAEDYVLNALMFTGNERTYQAWYGVPLSYLDTNRTFNPYTYKNEVDDYSQSHYQLHFTKQINNLSKLNISGHYTHGEGYYEQEKLNQSFSDYGLDNIVLSSDTISTTNLIRRKWLNNDFGGITFSITNQFENFNFLIGGAANEYSGQHYGNIVWSEYSSNSNYDHQYYWNKGEKEDASLYIKGDYFLNQSSNIYIDLQHRIINYSFQGYNEEGFSTAQNIKLDFFNPKFGIYHQINDHSSFYASYAVANKEPNRNDYVESTPFSRPKHETLYDTEIGYKISNKKHKLNINFYHMDYNNQLALTGKINDVGAYTRTNVKTSYRQGIEIDGSYEVSKKLIFDGNLTLSSNKIIDYNEYIDNWDTGEQEIINYEESDLAFSPNIIWSTILSYDISKNLNIELISKYVGEQFIDNTSSTDRMLNDYLVNHSRITYNWQNNLFKTAKITFQINNILNNEYVSNAWVYRFISDYWDPRSGDPYINKDSQRGYNQASYFPEALRNFMLSITLGF